MGGGAKIESTQLLIRRDHSTCCRSGIWVGSESTERDRKALERSRIPAGPRLHEIKNRFFGGPKSRRILSEAGEGGGRRGRAGSEEGEAFRRMRPFIGSVSKKDSELERERERESEGGRCLSLCDSE